MMSGWACLSESSRTKDFVKCVEASEEGSGEPQKEFNNGCRRIEVESMVEVMT